MAGADAPGGSRFSSATLKRGIEAYLREHIEQSDDIEFLVPIEEIRFEESYVVAQCTIIGERLWGQTTIEVTFQRGDKVLQRIRMPVRIIARRMLPIARRTIERGTIITSDDITYELRDATSLVDLLPDSIIGMRTTRTISQGTTILRTYVSGSGSVRTGDPVTLVVCHGSIVIRTTARALQNADAGSPIKVRRNDTGAVLIGKLNDAKTVVVELDRELSPTIGQNK
ncbi:MAG: flagellar basal body P-ring formation chaperone FlgA [Chlorobi bacterium]|nr:flagellar basal body P-ring formation chaperone FlgA [Chlorobiota bacterium]